MRLCLHFSIITRQLPRFNISYSCLASISVVVTKGRDCIAVDIVSLSGTRRVECRRSARLYIFISPLGLHYTSLQLQALFKTSDDEYRRDLRHDFGPSLLALTCPEPLERGQRSRDVVELGP